jgi:hypothetical protein
VNLRMDHSSDECVYGYQLAMLENPACPNLASANR